MKTIKFDNDLNVFIYETLREFTDKLFEEYKHITDFSGNTADNFYEFYCDNFHNKIENGFVDNTGMHLWFEKDCPEDEIIFTIGHELGHLQPRVNKNVEEEFRADMYGGVALDTYQIYKLIKNI